jgi:RHS repeat-associated protein
MVENNQYYFYHNDHLGTPQKIVDTSGRTVWSATYDSFGNIQIAVAEIENNLRFPGQYYDAETGKHYNWNRYYDPKTGTYISEDPIGFEGGDVNLYRYVNNSPQVWMDPWGLYSWGEFMEDWATVADIRAAQQYWQNYGGPVGSVMSGLLSFSGLATVQESGETLGDPCKSTGQKIWAGAKIVGVGASWYLVGATRGATGFAHGGKNWHIGLQLAGQRSLIHLGNQVGRGVHLAVGYTGPRAAWLHIYFQRTLPYIRFWWPGK